MTELEILSTINANSPMDYVDFLNHARLKYKANAVELQRHLEYMMSEEVHYLAGRLGAYGQICITPEGQARLQHLLLEANERKAQYRHDWKIAIFSALFGALLSEPVWSLIYFLIDLISTRIPIILEHLL